MRETNRLDDLEYHYSYDGLYLWEIPELWARRHPVVAVVLVVAFIILSVI